jgi:hypothetical protein
MCTRAAGKGVGVMRAARFTSGGGFSAAAMFQLAVNAKG